MSTTANVRTLENYVGGSWTHASEGSPSASGQPHLLTLERTTFSAAAGQHLTQKQLAERSGIDQAEISRIERGQANPTTTLGALTGALGLDIQLVPGHRAV